jgi:hypothetical protein
MAFGNLWLQMTTEHNPEIFALSLENNRHIIIDGRSIFNNNES